MKQMNWFELIVVTLATLLICSGCTTPQPGDQKSHTRALIQKAMQDIGDGEVASIVKTETVAKRLDQAGLGQYATAIRTGQVGLTALRGWLIERGIIQPTAADTADLLGGFEYGTSYTIVFSDGKRMDVPADAQIVAVDTPIAPKMPDPRIRTLPVKEIAPKIKDATKDDPLDGLIPQPDPAPAGDGLDDLGGLKVE